MNRRSDHVEKARARLARWNAEIDVLKARIEEARADARIEGRDRLADLRERRDEAARRLDRLQGAGAEAWDEMQDGFERAGQELERAVRRARARFH